MNDSVDLKEAVEPELIRAVTDGDFETASALVDGGAAVDQFDSSGRTPLMLAARLEDDTPAEPKRWFRRRSKTDIPQESPSVRITRKLLEAGARHDLKSYSDWTPLFHAARKGNLEVCEVLLAAGADPHMRNFKGRTALMLAAHHLYDPVLRLLVDQGVDVNVVDGDGRTALDFVLLRERSKARKVCRRLLRKAGAKRGDVPRGTPRTRIGAFLARVFALDEFAQSRVFLRWGMGFLLLVMTLFLTGEPDVVPPIVTISAVSLLLLLSFPSIVHLPYLLLTSREQTARDEPRRELDRTSHVAALDAVSNLMRLGWVSLGELVAQREERPLHVRSHLASIGLAGAIAASGLLIRYSLYQSDPPAMAISAGAALSIAGATLLLALLLEGSLRKGRLRAMQAAKDRAAAEINERISTGMDMDASESAPFILYLRTFGVTGKLRLGGMEFETAVAYNIAPFLPMIALGHPGESIGAGRVLTSEEAWRQEILRLIEHASVVMLIPSHREGTFWEILQLKERNNLGKTIFAMPPDVPFDDGSYADEWNRAAARMRSIGLNVPLHYAPGLLFKLDAGGHLGEHAPLQAENFLKHLNIGSGHGPDDDPDGDTDSEGDAADGDGDSDIDGDGNGD